MGRTATDFNCQFSVPVFPRVAHIRGHRFQMQFIQCNNRLDVVSLFVFFWGKDYADHGTTFLCQTEESATLYKHCNRIWPFSFEDYWHIKSNTIAMRVESLHSVIFVVNCRCSVSPNSMTICLFGDEARCYFIEL